MECGHEADESALTLQARTRQGEVGGGESGVGELNKIEGNHIPDDLVELNLHWTIRLPLYSQKRENEPSMKSHYTSGSLCSSSLACGLIEFTTESKGVRGRQTSKDSGDILRNAACKSLPTASGKRTASPHGVPPTPSAGDAQLHP